MKYKLIVPFIFATMFFGSLSGILYMMNRNLANDMPQLLATQAAKVVDMYGVDAVNSQPTDLANNPVPFVIVSDKQSKPLAGTGYLDNKLAKLPVGVVNHATAQEPHAVTWQPQKNVRIASVTVLSKKGFYVTGGQSLRLTDDRAKRLLWFTASSFLATIAVLVTAVFLIRRHCLSRNKRCAIYGVSCSCKGACVCQVTADEAAAPVARPKSAPTKKSSPRKETTASK